jgi:hypothetical protein
MGPVDYATQRKSRAFVGTVSTVIVFYVVVVAFDLLTAGKAWGEALRSNIVAASIFGVFMTIWFDLRPRWEARRKRSAVDGDGQMARRFAASSE